MASEKERFRLLHAEHTAQTKYKEKEIQRKEEEIRKGERPLGPVPNARKFVWLFQGSCGSEGQD